MKLKDSFISQDVEDARFLVPLGGQAFSGIARGNKAAAAIIDLLREDTTEPAIVDAMCERFDSPREWIAEDVAHVLDTLREMHAIEE